MSIVAVLLAAGALSAPQPACPVGQQARPLAVHTACLINRARSRHGLRPMRFDRRLERAARGHSRDMVAHRYFSHESRSGLSPSDRIARTGWMRGRGRWRIGETIGWRSGPPSPRSIVRAWLRSPPHRRILLEPAFRFVGVGVARGTPSGRAGATYTADLGS
jgi:uncharacterized protein YkwD